METSPKSCGCDRPAVMLHLVQPLNAAGNYEHPSPLGLLLHRVSYRGGYELMPNILKQQEGATDEWWLDAPISKAGRCTACKGSRQLRHSGSVPCYLHTKMPRPGDGVRLRLSARRQAGTATVSWCLWHDTIFVSIPIAWRCLLRRLAIVRRVEVRKINRVPPRRFWFLCHGHHHCAMRTCS